MKGHNDQKSKASAQQQDMQDMEQYICESIEHYQVRNLKIVVCLFVAGVPHFCVATGPEQGG